MTTTERRRSMATADRDAARGLDLADHVVDLVRARARDAEVEVSVRRGSEALTRFATGFIHQNVASEINHVLIRVAVDDGRNASTSVDGPADDESLVRATDGVLEARHGGELYGFERLDAIISAGRELSAQDLAETILADCRDFAQNELSDDCAIVVIKRVE